MCVFVFNAIRFTNREPDYINFNPFKLDRCINWTKQDFEAIDAQVLTSPNNPNIITVIKLKLNDPAHHQYIHDMLYHISRNNP